MKTKSFKVILEKLILSEKFTKKIPKKTLSDTIKVLEKEPLEFCYLFFDSKTVVLEGADEKTLYSIKVGNQIEFTSKSGLNIQTRIFPNVDSFLARG